MSSQSELQKYIAALKAEILEYRTRNLEHTQECQDRVLALASAYDSLR